MAEEKELKHNKVSDIPSKKWTIDDENLDYVQIAKAACGLIKKGDTIYLNSGTSGNLMVKYLPHNFSYSVVTTLYVLLMLFLILMSHLYLY